MSEQDKKTSGGIFQSLKNVIERRRAVRVVAPDASVILTIDGKTVPALKVEDLSTRGIGLVLGFMPADSSAKIRFEEPALLKGLELKAEVRAVRKLEAGSDKLYFAGYEFIFQDDSESQRLYRWLSTRMESRQQSTSRKVIRQAATSSGSRPEPTLVSSQQELKECAKLFLKPAPHFGLTGTRFFIAVNGSRVVASLPLIEDSEKHRLPLDDQFAANLDSFRLPERKIAQVWTPSFCDDWVSSLNPRTAPLQKIDTLFSLFSLALVYAMDYARITDIVTAPPPHLEEFFKMWLFERAPEADGLMRLNLTGFEARTCIERPELTSHLGKIRKRVQLSAALHSGFRPDPEFLKSWLHTCPEA